MLGEGALVDYRRRGIGINAQQIVGGYELNTRLGLGVFHIPFQNLETAFSIFGSAAAGEDPRITLADGALSEVDGVPELCVDELGWMVVNADQSAAGLAKLFSSFVEMAE